MSEMIEPGFDSSALNGYFMVDMPLKDIVAELIDNAFDADADSIRVDISNQGISVMDNGDGISELTNMFRVGKSGRHSSVNSIGRFGVGAKNALLAVGSITDICTNFEGKFHEAQADWKHMASNGFDLITEKVTDDKSKLRKSNARAMSWWTTRVSVRRPHAEKGKIIKNAPALAKSMAIRYRPALLNGKTIVMSMNHVVYDLKNHEACKPTLTNEINYELSINGKALKINAGIAIEHVPGLTGYALVSYGNRLIENTTNIFNHILDRKFFLSIDLSNDWRKCLATHKNKITTDRELLMESVWKIISDTVKELDRQKKELIMEITLDGIGKDIGKVLQKLNEIGTQDIGDGDEDETRDPGEGTAGPPNPDNDDGPTKPATIIDGKNKVKRKPKPSPRNIQFVIDCRKDLLGLTDVDCDVGPHAAIIIVYINDGQELIKEMVDDESKRLQLLIATSLAQYFLTDEGKPNSEKLFGHSFSNNEMTESLQYGYLSGEILKRLSVPKTVTDKEMDF